MAIFAIFVVAFTSFVGFVESLTRGEYLLALGCLTVFLAVAIPILTSKQFKELMK